MYKSKLQELCQSWGLGLPNYTTTKSGPDHAPRFSATVNVRGQVFTTPAECKSSKEAQVSAAQLAFERLCSASSLLPGVPTVEPSPVMQPNSRDPWSVPESPNPSSLPLPPRGLLLLKGDATCQDTKQASTGCRNAADQHVKIYRETLHVYKNRLQQYAQKQNIGFPVYTCETEGPPHARRFRSSVILNGNTYETVEYLPTLKEAEQAAAKVACQMLSLEVIQENGGAYKSLLQEFAQKKGFMSPSYETKSSGVAHLPVFVCTVVVGKDSFRGSEAKTKKQAEMNAAKVAYCTLTEGCPAAESSLLLPSTDSVTLNFEATPKKQRDETDEEESVHAKRAKTASENITGDPSQPASPNLPSDNPVLLSSQTESAISNEPAVAQPTGNNSSPSKGIILMPRESMLLVPEGASVMPFSDDQCVAYKMGPAKETAA